MAAGQCHRYAAIFGGIDGEAGIFQQAARDFLVDRFILGQQQAGATVFVERRPIGRFPITVGAGRTAQCCFRVAFLSRSSLKTKR